MNQLDKWNKELELLSKASYKKMDKELYTFYKEALKKLKVEIKKYIDEYEELSFSERLQAEKSIKTANRIDEILWNLSDKAQPRVYEYVRSEIEDGYYGSWYTLEGKENIQVDFSMLNESYIERLVDKKVSGKNFSKRLYEYRDKLAENVTSSLLNGAIAGKGYAYVAKEIGELTEADYKRALRIARTEGGRVQSTVRQKAYEEAKDKGIDLQKRWMATLDKRTRHSHQELDGQTIGVDEKFIFNGYKADGPRLFGIASLDINCRCTTISVVNDIDPAVRRDNETKEFIEYKSYKEWKSDKVKKHGQKRWKIDEKKIKNKSSDIKQYNKYKRVIGKKNIPKTLDEFQELKYNNSKEWELIKDHYYVKSRLKEGQWGKNINKEKQAPHMESTVKQGKSYFYDGIDVQRLFNKYAGTGYVEKDRSGKRTNKETVMTDNILGYDEWNKILVKGIKIHHSKNRTHVVPFKGRN